MTTPAIIPLGTNSIGRAGGSTVVITTTAKAPIGSLILVFAVESGTGVVASLTDSHSNTYTVLGSTTDHANIDCRAFNTAALAAALPIGSTITAVWGGSASPPKILCAYALTGIVAFDQLVIATPVSGTQITATSGTLMQYGNEIAVFCTVEDQGEADGDFVESVGFTTLDQVFDVAFVDTAYMVTGNAAPVVYQANTGVSNSLICMGVIYAGVFVPPPLRRMTARIRGVPPIRPNRLQIRGTRMFLPNGAPFVFRGINQDGSSLISPDDAIQAASMGANCVRITIAFWFDGSGDCSTPIPNYAFDAFDPNSPATGYLDPTLFGSFQAAVLAAIANGLWPILTFHGADCNFGTYIWPSTGLTVVQMFREAWKYIASQFVNVAGIGAYEIISEPHPTNNPTDNSNNPASGNSPTDTGPGAAWLFNQVIADIRNIDPFTPIVIGPAAGYNIRFGAQVLANIEPQNLPNLIWTADFFELGTLIYINPSRNGGYVRQLKDWPGFPNGTNYTGYPGLYYDRRGGRGGWPYPGEHTQVYMDQAWLAGLSNVMVEICAAYNLPGFLNQYGNATGTPDIYQYTSDVSDNFITQGLGFVFWAQRLVGHPGNGSGQGIIWQDQANNWHIKNGKDPAAWVMDQYGAWPGQVQDTNDWIALLTAKFKAPI